MKLQGWKYRDIAGKLGLTVGAVALRLYRARAILRGLLESPPPATAMAQTPAGC